MNTLLSPSSLPVLEDKQKNLKGVRSDFEKDPLAQLLTRCQGKVNMAAKITGKYRSDIYERHKKHDLKKENFRNPER